MLNSDFEWIRENYAELQEKYRDKYIAVRNRKVIASGRDSGRFMIEQEKFLERKILP